MTRRAFATRDEVVAEYLAPYASPGDGVLLGHRLVNHAFVSPLHRGGAP